MASPGLLSQASVYGLKLLMIVIMPLPIPEIRCPTQPSTARASAGDLITIYVNKIKMTQAQPGSANVQRMPVMLRVMASGSYRGPWPAQESSQPDSTRAVPPATEVMNFALVVHQVNLDGEPVLRSTTHCCFTASKCQEKRQRPSTTLLVYSNQVPRKSP